MKNLLLITLLVISLSSCRKFSGITDSDIAAIRDQTEVLKEQNRILNNIARSLEKIEENN